MTESRQYLEQLSTLDDGAGRLRSYVQQRIDAALLRDPGRANQSAVHPDVYTIEIRAPAGTGIFEVAFRLNRETHTGTLIGIRAVED